MDNGSSFIFVKSVTTDDRSTKRPSWSKKPYVRTYSPAYDEDKEWILKDMKDQIVATVSCLQEAELKDKDQVYIVLGVQSQFVENEDPSKVRKAIFYENTLNLIKSLSAEILCYLNSEHTNLLISCPLSNLTHILNKRTENQSTFARRANL